MQQSMRGLPLLRASNRSNLSEIHREDIAGLPRLMALLRGKPWRFLVFCDDLSFDAADSSYKSLKAALEGGIEGRPGNVLFYATSNRRHILPREMIENERGTAINPDDAVQEKISLSDRFGLWLGFHACRKTIILRWSLATPSISILLARAKKSSARRSNEPSRGARVPGGRPGNISRILPGGSARQCSHTPLVLQRPAKRSRYSAQSPACLEQHLPPIATLRHMMRRVGKNEAREPRHECRIGRAGKLGNWYHVTEQY